MGLFSFKPKKPKKKYKARVECANCNYEFNIQVDEGTSVNDFVKDMPCPKCKCKELINVGYDEEEDDN